MFYEVLERQRSLIGGISGVQSCLVGQYYTSRWSHLLIDSVIGFDCHWFRQLIASASMLTKNLVVNFGLYR